MLNPTEESQTVIPAFIAKLWHMIKDSSSDNLISWGDTGKTFIIKDHNKFASEMLPMYYKHNKMASFIRQLNMYNFHKVFSVESPTLKNQEELEFSHPCFIKDQPQLLTMIHRKIHSKESAEVRCDPIVFNNLLKEVKQLRAIQEIFSTKLSVMKKENAALWREHSILRQRHAKQEKIVNKVIHFLISMVHQSSINVTRRKIPLMIKDRPTFKQSNKKRSQVRSTNSKSTFIPEMGRQDSSNINAQIIGEEILPEALLSNDEDDNISTDLGKSWIEADNSQEVQNQEQEFISNNIPNNSNRILLKTIKRKSNKIKGQQVSNKRIKSESIEPSEYILPEVFMGEDPNESNFNDSESRPEYLIINSEDDIAELLSGDVEMVASPEDGIILQGPISKQIKFQQPSSTNENVPIITRQTMPVEKGVAEDLLTPASTAPELNVETRLSPSPIPVVTSPAQSIPSPTPPQTTSTPAETSTTNSSKSLNTGKSLLQLALPVDLSDTIKNKEDAEVHLDRVQSDLEILKDLLKSEGISLDANMVLELFNDNPIDLNMGPAEKSINEPSSSDQALVCYTPSLLDFDPPDLPSDDPKLEDEQMPDFILNTPQIRTQSPSFPDSS